MKINKYQIFIASSLSLKEHRSVIDSAIQEVNRSEIAKKNNVIYEEFLYERRPDISQKLEKRDAQAPADRALRCSSIFFLVIDDVIRDLTRYEFELAKQRFDQGLQPQYIFFFHKTETATQNSPEGKSYDEFAKEYNLNDYFYDLNGKPVLHRRIYDIPFDSLTEGNNSLKTYVIKELERLIDSNELPFPDAALGHQLDENDFFVNDSLRLKNSPSLYYRRHVDDQLESALGMNSIVVLTGASLSGKTRAMMEAMKNVKDGWVFVINKRIKEYGHDKQKQIDLIKELRSYMTRNDPPKLYIVIDDIGQFSGDVRAAIEELVSTLLGTRSQCVLVATTTDEDISLAGISKDTSRVEVLRIEDMTYDDFKNVERYFLSCGIQIDSERFKYKMMGALFVNLDEVKERYDQFLKGSDMKDDELLKEAVKKVRCIVRRMILKSIKAQSIWRDDFLGSVRLLSGMAKYFTKKDPQAKNYDIDEGCFNDAFNNALEVLTRGGKMGVSRQSVDMLDIQEYVYQYFIDYNGELQTDNGNPLDDGDVTKVKAVVRDILDYCDNDRSTIQEPLTYQVSRLTSRCPFKESIVGWLYGLWNSEGESDDSLAIVLQDDRHQCEKQGAETAGQSLTKHHYTKVIENYIYECCDFEEAWNAFDKCSPSMWTDHLLSALMRKARNSEERERVLKHNAYIQFQNYAYVIRAELEWTTDFSTAAQVMRRFITKESPKKVAERLLKRNEIQYDIVQLTRSMSTLIWKVETKEDLESALDILRQCYTMFIKDYTLLEKIRNSQIDAKENHTIVDLLSKLNPYALIRCVNKLYGNNIDDSLSFINKLTDSVADTLKNGFTTETEIRLLISWIGRGLILCAAKNGYSYDEVYDWLFSALQIPHPKKPGVDIIFRNSFTYTAIMQCDDCTIVNAINLFENDLVKHATDRNNPIYINCYTLNILMEKCGKKYRTFVDRVNSLYNQLNLDRDVYSYYNLLKGNKAGALSLNDSVEILREMKISGVKQNVYTLTALMSCKDMDISMALSFFEYPVDLIPDDYIVNDFCPEGVEVISSELKKALVKYDEAWCAILRKPCKTPKEREVFDNCIAFLEREENREILKSGKIYNTLIGNKDYLPNTIATIVFIEKKTEGGFLSPDDYTVNLLFDKILKEHDNIRKSSLKRFEAFLEANPTLINDMLIKKRLCLYDNIKHQLWHLFVEKDGQTCKRLLTPIGYIKAMQEYHIPVDKFVIGVFTDKNKFPEISPNTFKTFMDVLKMQEDYYKYDSQDSEMIRERCGDYLEDYHLNLTPISVLSHNKRVRKDFKKNGTDIKTALSLLNWANENSAVVEFNDIVSTYIDRFPQKNTCLFEEVMGYYDCYLGTGSGHRPSSFTFGVLAKAISNIDDYRRLFKELRLRKKTQPRLVFYPALLSRLSAVIDNLDDLAKETKGFMNAGGIVNKQTADIYLYRMAQHFFITDKEKAINILDDVFHYIIAAGDSNECLSLEERECLLLPFYKNSANVSEETLHVIIKYNDIIKTPLDLRQIVDAIGEKYAQCIPNLMNMLVVDREMVHQQEILPLLFDKLKPRSRPMLKSSVLVFLAKQIPRYDINAYNAFLRQLYTIDCRNNIEGAIPDLVNCIHRLSNKLFPDEEQITQIRKTESKIFTYAELGQIRCGHLLLEKAPEECLNWCIHSLDSRLVNKLLEERFAVDRKTFKDRIKYFVDNLDDAFVCSLQTFKKHQQKGNTVDAETKLLVERQQADFAARIKRGDVKFLDMRYQPLLWIQTCWIPSVDLLLAIISNYASTASDNGDYSNEAVGIIHGITKKMMIADSNNSANVFIPYSILGRFTIVPKFSCSVPINELAAVLYPLAVLSLNGMFKTASDWGHKHLDAVRIIEQHFVQYLKMHQSDYDTIVALPDIWRKTQQYLPSEEMVRIVIESYSTIFALGAPHADEADLHIDQLLKAKAWADYNKKAKVILKYGMLGEIDHDHDKSQLKVSVEMLQEALPDEYILILRRIAKQNNISASLKHSINLLKQSEENYSLSLAEGKVPYPPLILPDLWYQCGYIPSEKIVLSLVKCYLILADKYEIVKLYLQKIEKFVLFSKKKKFDKTRIKYNMIGICPDNCNKYVPVNTVDLCELLQPEPPMSGLD